MIRLTFNGRPITSQGQLRREFEKSMLAAVDRHVRSAVPPGVKLTKTSKGYKAEGDATAIERMVRRLSK